MKNNLINIALSVFMLVFYTSCVDDDFEFGELTTPSNLSVSAEVVGQSEENPFGDGTGEVIFNASADGAMTYKYVFENGSSVITPSGVYSHSFSQTGTKVYTVNVIAYGPGGTASSMTTEVEVLVTYEPPQDLIDKLVGKEWRIKSEAPGHFGLGPVGGVVPNEWYGAGPNDKAGRGMYDDRYIFSEDGTFTHITDINSGDDTGTIFGRTGLIDEIASCSDCVIESDGNDILNVPYSNYSENWFITAPGGAETINLTGNGFIGYYVGGDHKYEIWDRSGNELLLRTTDGRGELDWWFLLTSEPEGGTSEPEEFQSQFNTLLWEDNFDAASLDTNTWNIETGNNNGWGNEEDQYYTADNVTVQDGNLVITAKAEAFNEYNFTSARITTKGNFDFTYGRVEVKAQLPSGGGVWPAIWMLGADFDTAGWPATGEIDIMEYKGNEPNVIHGSLHFPGNSGGDAVTESTTVANVESDFHLYSVEWTEEKIVFLVDNVVYHEFANSNDVPFNKDFFLILNVAMGGTFGGDIDANFTESSMVIDYVKVFQE
ncbi:glycoside hydrolase family 16 protein [Salinimicrobium gaetbulicola]|uniref:Family 16 glycosylhydrolase n=1 Tax=Salinimicrobium gaetbulicola TaxID=999702 RepID=A0ABW3IH41_9FLAO